MRPCRSMTASEITLSSQVSVITIIQLSMQWEVILSRISSILLTSDRVRERFGSVGLCGLACSLARTPSSLTPLLLSFDHEKNACFFNPLCVDMNMKVCIACDFCYPSSNMYNFEQVLNRLSWLCLFLFFSRVLLLGGRDRREGGWMSKGDERRVLRNRGEKFGWSGERELSFPSYIYFLTILSVSHLSNFDSRFFCSFGRFTSLHLKTDGKLQHNLKVKKIVKY